MSAESNGRGSLRDFYTTVYLPLRLRGKSSSRQRQYHIQLNHFARFLGREATFDDLRDEIVSQLLRWLVEHGRAPATANKARNHLLALWRLAARKGFVAHYPDVPPENEPRRIPKAWLVDDLANLFAAIDGVRGTICGIPASLWWHALHSVLWWTGERIGAVLQLRWEHLDAQSGWLTIPAELRKRKTADKIFELSPDALRALARITFPKRALIFPWILDSTTLYYQYTKILKAAGLPTDRKSKFHRMRRSTASYFEAAGGNATALLGHSQRSTTLGYLDPRIVKPEQPKDLLFIPHRDKPQPPAIG
jgi:integrase